MRAASDGRAYAMDAPVMNDREGLPTPRVWLAANLCRLVMLIRPDDSLLFHAAHRKYGQIMIIHHRHSGVQVAVADRLEVALADRLEVAAADGLEGDQGR